ncbi:phage repressor protein [Haladaptatus sp. R4]|uniref:winged-helix domain-containing protein n=1 Tax=Haladaptatus sp. R4 TaxID=1679489 RepID=UPI0007B4DBA9|nr:winged-helix domain-containing protein [Haladaptatus sp. R4]KZN23688.1 phage repressor protein [Haladaptatus sp. R4]
MTGNDDRILELLSASGVALNKKALEVNFELEGTGISYSTIKRRLPLLESVGLVDEVRETGSYYRITDKGEAYLAGELDASELELNEESL